MTSKIRLEGPFMSGSTSDGYVDMYVGDESGYEAQTDTRPKDIPGQEDEDSVLAPISGSRSFRFQGTAVTERLLREGYGGGTSRRDALLEWIYEAESLCVSEQGEGYHLIDDSRGFDRSPGDDSGFMVEEVSWTHEVDAPMDVSWRLELLRVEGVQNAGSRSQYVTDQEGKRNPNISADAIETEDFTLPLGEVESRSYERGVELNAMEMMHQYDVEAYGLVESGVQGQFTIQGRLTDRHVGSLADLREASVRMNEDLHGLEGQLHDSLTQRTFQGAVSDTKSTFEAGNNILQYDITFKIGDVAV